MSELPRTVFELTPNEWIEIKKIAITLHDNNVFSGDQFKCGIAAFVEWISNQDENFQLAVEMNNILH